MHMHRIGVFLLLAGMLLVPGTVGAQTIEDPARHDSRPDDSGPANTGLYVGGSGGLAFFSEIEGADYELGLAVSGFAGIYWGSNWRGELDLSYESAEFENSSDDTSLFRVSGALYRDFDRSLLGNWVPYLGGGVGIVDIDVGNDEDNTELSAHAEGGFSVPLGAKLHVVPGVRVEYIILDNIDDQVITQLRAGLRFGL